MYQRASDLQVRPSRLKVDIMISLASVLVASALALHVAAHGYVPQLKIGSNYIAGWNVNTGRFMTILLTPFNLSVTLMTSISDGYTT